MPCHVMSCELSVCLSVVEFEKAGIDLDKPLIASCGSGITACWIAFAASLLGKEVPVYDVSDCSISVH